MEHQRDCSFCQYSYEWLLPVHDNIEGRTFICVKCLSSATKEGILFTRIAKMDLNEEKS